MGGTSAHREPEGAGRDTEGDLQPCAAHEGKPDLFILFENMEVEEKAQKGSGQQCQMLQGSRRVRDAETRLLNKH